MLVACAAAFENRPRTRVLIRKLPANIDAAAFLASLDDILTRRCDAQVRQQICKGIAWCHLIPNLGAAVSHSSVAYIIFMDKADAKTFISHYNGYRFVDPHGALHDTDCSLTIFQRHLVPQSAQQGYKQDSESPLQYYESHPDVLCQACYVQDSETYGTYETDPAYLQYLQLREEQPDDAYVEDDFLEKPLITLDSDGNVVSPAVRTAIERRLARRNRTKRSTGPRASNASDRLVSATNNANWNNNQTPGEGNLSPPADFPTKPPRGSRRHKDPNRACNSASPQAKKSEISKVPSESTPSKLRFSQRRSTTYPRNSKRDAPGKGD